MNLDELSATLPNGFHDARLRTLAIDYVKREARLALDLSVGDPDSTTAEGRDASVRVCLVLSSVAFLVCEPPAGRDDRQPVEGLSIDIGPMWELKRQPTTLPPVSAGCSVNWVFVRQWNAFMYVASSEARLEYTSEN